jgi:hypothetical protein
MSYISTTTPVHELENDTFYITAEISRIQKRLSDQIAEKLWMEKEDVRLQESIKHLQKRNLVSRRHYNCLERA